VSPSGQPYAGLTGSESNPDPSGQPVTVFRIEPAAPSAYFMPGADPGEGYKATNSQLFGSIDGPGDPAEVPGCQGFVKDFGYTLGWQSREKGWPIVPGTVPGDIMGCFAPDALSARGQRRRLRQLHPRVREAGPALNGSARFPLHLPEPC
jgi:phospholipase C